MAKPLEEKDVQAMIDKALKEKDRKEFGLTEEEVKELFIELVREAAPRLVADFHRSSDSDSRLEALHHTLGMRRNQASPGDHIHDGQNGIALLGGVVYSGSRIMLGDVVLQIMNSLKRLGASDNTTP